MEAQPNRIMPARSAKRSAKKLRDIQFAQIGQIFRLLMRRNLWPLPPDERSVRHLQALFDLGMTTLAAKNLAPWLAPEQRRRMAEVRTARWSNRTLGDLFEVTLEEKLDRTLNLRNLECYEADRWRVQEERQIRDRPANSAKVARWRAKQPKPQPKAVERVVFVLPPSSNAKRIETFGPGEQAVYMWLSAKGKRTISAMADFALAAPQGQLALASHGPDGRLLIRHIVMRKLGRWCDGLKDGGLVDDDLIPGLRSDLRRVWRLDEAP